MIGKRINDRYHILEDIGGGGMANVYKAKDHILDRVVAVKVLQPQYSRDEQFIKRFRREAQAATSLAHENVVSIYDVGEEDDVYYIVMEYVEGPTLKELIQKEGAVTLDRTIHIMSQVMSAISHAHANHIVHRDIKPHNILISKDDVVKVTDFGIARAMSSATITHTNSVMGSVHYLSPEQARGGTVNFKSDIYSLGIVLYEMVTGRVPFSGDTAVSIAIKHLQNAVPSPKSLQPSLPQSIENIIMKATAKEPHHRYESVQEMEDDLETSLDPARVNEPAFVIPIDDEATKAIPIIKEVPIKNEDLQKTMEAPAIEKNKQETIEHQKEKQKKGKKKWLTIVLTILFVFIGAGIAAFAIFPSLLKVDEVEVPSVVAMEYELALETLEELGLHVEQELVPDNEVEENVVVRQIPVGGSTVKVNTTVTLYVSEGKQKEEMPNFIGYNKERVERMLQNFADYEFIEEPSEEHPIGTIIQQEPEAETLVVIEETKVILTYSVEPIITLQNLKGLKDDEVRRYFENQGLIGNFKTNHSSSVEEGHVISQSPSAFTEVKKGSSVEVVISLGPEQKEEPPQTRTIEAVLPIEVSPEHKEEGREFAISIVIEDATTSGEKVFLEETITDSKTYRIPLKVSPEKNGVYKLYIDGKLEVTNEFSY